MASARTEVAVASAEEPVRPSRVRRGPGRLARGGMALAGVAVGLGVAELAFRHRDHAAFPHLNVYRPDAALGVRLEPGATQRFQFADNPVTDVRINSTGYRGAEWPAAGSDDVVIAGDSQTFGLGVEEGETFSAGLATQLHRTVLDAGVPTYGPAEYRAVIEELLEQRHPKTVVVGLNMVNDLFEINHPNRERHAVWDGWAVRRESAPDEIRDFPGRGWLYRESHLFFAARKWWHSGDPVDAGGFASEGTWTDLVARGREIGAARASQTATTQARAEERRKLQHDLAGADDQVQRAIFEILRDDVPEFGPESAARAVVMGDANPGDIIDSNFGAEESRAIVITSDMIRTGAEVRKKLRAKLAAWAKANARGTRGAQVQAALDTSTSALARLSELDAQRIEAALEPPLLPYVRDLEALCEAHGARLVVLVLPIDVAVSATEWNKYGVAPGDRTGSAAGGQRGPIDMAPARALSEELVAATQGLGISALDATSVLAAAEPGAFLDRDIHMTPKGHAAVATALAAVIAAPPPVRSVARSAVPVPAVWQAAPEIVVAGSSKAGCETKVVREWLRVMCTSTVNGNRPLDVAVQTDATGEAMALVVPRATSLVVPLMPGREVVARFGWDDHTRLLHVTWPDGASAGTKPRVAFDERVEMKRVEVDVDDMFSDERPAASKYRSPVEAAICGCWVSEYRSHANVREDAYVLERYASWNKFSCVGAYGAPDARCTKRYAKECARMFECMWRDPASPPEGP